MKRLLAITAALIIAGIHVNAYAGEMDVLVDKLVEKGVLSPVEAQIILDEAKHEMAKEIAEGTAATAPGWTQKIKMKGDVRFRTQWDWGKNDGGTDFRNANYRIRERIRARIALEGKVNDQVSGGVRIVSGSGSGGRSTNQTFDDNFEKWQIWFDRAYLKWEPRLEQMPYLTNTSKFWFGMFANPFQTTELVWDSDINPHGIAIQYMSPAFKADNLPETNFFFNQGTIWLDENLQWMGDPMLCVFQGGLDMLVAPDWGGNLKTAVAYYGFGNTKGKSMLDDSAQTNTREDFSVSETNRLRYNFYVLDFLVRYDAKKFLGFEFPHGILLDFIYNADATRGFGMYTGGYVGDKSPKKKGQWQVFCNYRLLQKDCIPDFMPDSDFFGFRDHGTPAGGGTNAQGVNYGLQYAIFDNTVLNLEQYITYPLHIDPMKLYDNFYSLFQWDVIIKF